MLKEYLLPKPAKIEEIARQTKLIRRHSRKFSANGFLLSLVKSVVKGDTSLNQIAMNLAGFSHQSMTRQAVFQRLGPASTSFLLGILNQLLATRFPLAERLIKSRRFGRVLVEDSTVISMARSNAENFPNNGNGKFMTAGCKFLLVADLLSGKTVECQLHAAREADQSLAFESVDLCRKGDLIIRDMGFFQLSALEEIERRKAFWVSRIPAMVRVVDDSGKALRHVLAKARGNVLDLPVQIGRGAMPCRLVAIRLDSRRAEANRRHLRSESKRRRTTPNRESLLRAGWRLVATNLNESQANATEVSELYGLRWSIEIKFRAFKQSCKLSQGLKHQSGYHHIEAMVLAAMIYQLVSMKAHAALAKRREFQGWLSIEKVSDWLSIQWLTLCRERPSFEMPPDPRHLKYEKRTRTNHWQAMTYSLA